jgi:hypothetical protein
MSEGTGRQNIIYNSILKITVSFLGTHKWEPGIYIVFSPALPLQCSYSTVQYSYRSSLMGSSLLFRPLQAVSRPLPACEGTLSHSGLPHRSHDLFKYSYVLYKHSHGLYEQSEGTTVQTSTQKYSPCTFMATKILFGL